MWQLLIFARIACLPEVAAKDMLSHLTYQEIDMQYDTDTQKQDTTVHGPLLS